MTSKFELSIATGYVPNWGIVEAFRELFQNALDNEITHPENKMEWNYDEATETLKIGNKTSVLQAETLLLGCTTKANDKATIGKHGEGYKIAFMVLLRNDKKIKVYNYGNREIWNVRLVKSKKYNGQLVPTIFVEKGAFWSKAPNNDLTIEVSGVTKEEYREIVEKNLNLREDTVEKFSVSGKGEILLDESEAGNIYVKGLYVNNMEGLRYGYDFMPDAINLDRDRKLVNSFDISWEASVLWIMASSKDTELSKKALSMIKDNTLDVAYIDKLYYLDNNITDMLAEDFFKENGVDAIPVTSNLEYDTIMKKGLGRPIIVSDRIAGLIKQSSIVASEYTLVEVSVKDKLKAMLDKIEDRLSEEELEEFTELISQVKN